MAKISKEKFEEKFSELTISEKVAIYINYCIEHGDSDNTLYAFDEEFFENAFSDKMEVCRATYFGKIGSWDDPYIRFNAYGNLESLSEYDAESEIDDYLGEIYDHEDTWEDYIDVEDDEEEDDEEEDE